jgi:hypothetical protein
MKTNKRLILPTLLGAAALLASSLAVARVDVGINVGVPAPVYVAPAPVYAAPPPAAYVVGGPVVVLGWHGDRYWDGHRYWSRHDWNGRHQGHYH